MSAFPPLMWDIASEDLSWHRRMKKMHSSDFWHLISGIWHAGIWLAES
jgi:hypothetical protein